MNKLTLCDAGESGKRVAPVVGEVLGLSADDLEESQVQSLPQRPILKSKLSVARRLSLVRRHTEDHTPKTRSKS